MKFGCSLGCQSYWRVSGVPKWDGGGYTPVCFLKCVEVTWNQWVAGSRETSVCRRLKRRELGRGAFRRGEVSSHTSIAGGEVCVNNDLLHGNSNGGWGVRIRSVRKGFA